jgi:hypothetical protein
MRIQIITLVLVAALFSCSKPGTVEPSPGSVSFSANGTSYSWTEEDDVHNSNYLAMNFITSPGTYSFIVSSNWASSNLMPARDIEFEIPVSTFALNTPYTYIVPAPPPVYVFNGITVSNATTYVASATYTACRTGDNFTVTFTSIHSNMLDGTFTAKLTRMSDSSMVNITAGTFQNIKVQ